MFVSSDEQTHLWESWSKKEVKYIWEGFIMYTIH